jgi:hypothetical protein
MFKDFPEGCANCAMVGRHGGKVQPAVLAAHLRRDAAGAAAALTAGLHRSY